MQVTKSDLEEAWEFLTDAEKKEILKLTDDLSYSASEWQPLPGAQSLAYYSPADHLFYGGAAGGGKTDLLLGIAHQQHRRSIIYRREFTQLNGIIERGKELFDNRGKAKFNQQKNFWRIGTERLIELGACQHVGTEQKYQGVPHDLVGFDEITHFTEFQFRFLCGWLRSTTPGQRKRVICAGNPPTSAEGDWVISYWAPWLDEKHPNPADPGELRWFTTGEDGKDVEIENGEPFKRGNEIIRPESRTFIPASIEDNPYLLESGYKARLQALPEPLRSKLLSGSFTAGREDDAWQVIPTEWVRLAQQRWRESVQPNGRTSCIGVDVARGGKDKTVITKRIYNWFAPQISHPGTSTPNGQAVAALVVKELPPHTCMINIDVIGVGAAVYDVLRGTFTNAQQRDNVFGLQSAGTSYLLDKSKNLGFYNKRAEWYWKFREALDPVTGDNLMIPDDRELLSDLCAPRWEFRNNKILIESKADIEERIGRSPDKGDSMIYAHATPNAPPTAYHGSTTAR